MINNSNSLARLNYGFSSLKGCFMDITNRALGRDEIREIDREAIEEYEIPGIILMENAGRNVA